MNLILMQKEPESDFIFNSTKKIPSVDFFQNFGPVND